LTKGKKGEKFVATPFGGKGKRGAQPDKKDGIVCQAWKRNCSARGGGGGVLAKKGGEGGIVTFHNMRQKQGQSKALCMKTPGEKKVPRHKKGNMSERKKAA